MTNFAPANTFQMSNSEGGLSRARVTSGTCIAELYLQGAHLTQWHPAGQEPVLFMSERSLYEPGKSIRGGVPIIFPWFGPRTATPSQARTDGPSHGFARTSVWKMTGTQINAEGAELSFVLEPNDTSRSLGFDNFLVNYRLKLGAELQMSLTVNNLSQSTMHFEEALHTYFSVGDATKISISGLQDTEYLDKTDDYKRKRQSEELLKLTGETDRPYLNTEATVIIDDPTFERKIHIAKTNSKTTVVWNPWSELCGKLTDMTPDGWKKMVCIETANAAENLVTLPAGESHTMTATISVSR